MESLNISEIFGSLQGEGKFTGFPTTFIRLANCNLKCNYCDTCHKKKHKMLIDRICKYAFQMKNRHICITGGEPLLQEAVYVLIYDLLAMNYIVTIETNGTIPIDETYHRSYSYCMDVKCPSSGDWEKTMYSNLANLQSHDEVKFVVRDLSDYNFATEVLRKYPTKAQIIMSPVFEGSDMSAEWLIESIQDDKIPNVRLGVQLHKLLDYK